MLVKIGSHLIPAYAVYHIEETSRGGFEVRWNFGGNDHFVMVPKGDMTLTSLQSLVNMMVHHGE